MSSGRRSRSTRRRFLAAGLGIAASPALAQTRPGEETVTEVIPLGYRGAAEVIEVVRPLVPAPGVVTGLGSQLVVRTTPERLVELRRVIEALDRPPANLLVSVRRDADEEVLRDLARAGVEAGSAGLRARAQARASRSTARGSGVQRLRVLEGREAFIATGESVPVAEREVTITAGGAVVTEGVRYRDATSGFWVRPRLSGERVVVEIARHRDALSARGGGRVDVDRGRTVLTAPLGRWVEIGTVASRSEAGRSGLVARAGGRERSHTAVYVKIERID